MKFARRLLMAVALAAVAQPAAAQPTEQLKFTSPGTVTGFGYYVGPYQGIVQSQPGTPTIDLFCVDFLHRISKGQVWTAYFSVLSGSLAKTRGGDPAYDLYLRSAWLISQYGVSSPTEWKNIQATIWNLFAGSAPDPTTSHWLTQANANYQSVNPNYWYVVTDVNAQNANSAQEFMTYVTPEPSTYLLLVTGLCFLGFLYMRRPRPGLLRF
jgi:hypothetical protein